MKLSIVLYRSKTLAKDGEHPIMLRLFKGKYFYKSLGISCKVSDWNEKENKCRKSFDRYQAFNKTIQREYNSAQERIDNIIANKKPFSIDYIFQTNDEKRKTLLDVIREEKDSKTKYNTIRKYINLENRLKEYELEHTYIDEVNVEFLEKFYHQLKNTRKDISTYTYMAVLRSCLMAAKRKKYISENPFIYSNFKYDKKTKKRALNRFDIDRLIAYYKFTYDIVNLFATEEYTLSDTSSEYYALNLFLSSYYLQGLSIIDLAELRVKDAVITQEPIGEKQDFKKYNEQDIMLTAAMDKHIMDNPNDNDVDTLINYINSRKDNIIPPLEYEKILTIELHRKKTNKPVKIVHEYKTVAFLLDENLNGKDENDYLFNIYNEKCKNNITTKNSCLTYTTHLCNKKLEEVRKKLGLKIDRLTMYSARHTYASTLYHSGENANIIAQNMGRDIRDINTYLQEFDNNKIKKSNSVL